MPSVLRPLLLASTLALSAHASWAVVDPAPAYEYRFSATPAGFDPISVSFVTPHLLSAGEPFSFNSFTITNGSESWVMEHGSSTALASQGRCFLFGSQGMSLPNGPDTACGLSADGGGAGFWFFDGQASLPSAPGQYSGLFVSVVATGVSGADDPNGLLTISAVPEPEAALMWLAGLSALAYLSRRRSPRH